MFHQDFVSVLAVSPVVKDTATLSPKAAQKLVSQKNALCVRVSGDVDRVFIVKVVFDISVKIAQVVVRPVRHADNVREADFDETQSVHFALCNDTFSLTLDSVNVVREKLSP